MKNQTLRVVLAGGLAGALAWGAGCASVPSGVDPSYQVVDSSMLGSWTSPAGTSIQIDRVGTQAFEIELHDGTSDAKYRGHLLSIDGKRFVEVSLFQPEKSSEVPVYHYAMVDEIGPDALTHRPIKAQWLAEASRNIAGAIYQSTAQEQPDTGGVVVRNRGAMLQILRKASNDPSAFGPPETLKRKK